MIVYDVKSLGHLKWKFLTSGKRECIATAYRGHLNVTMNLKSNGRSDVETIDILEGELGSYVPSWDEVFTVISRHEIDRGILAAVGVKSTGEGIDEEE